MQSSPLPLSFDGNPVLYAFALWAITSIAFLGASVASWMIRDTWKDRTIVHPKSLLFYFRTMVFLAAVAAFCRSTPEAIYLQMYGEHDVAPTLVRRVLQVKRFMDSTSIAWVVGWTGALVAMYPGMCVALKQGPARVVVVDALSPWHKLVRPTLVTMLIGAVSGLMAYTKVYGV